MTEQSKVNNGETRKHENRIVPDHRLDLSTIHQLATCLSYSKHEKFGNFLKEDLLLSGIRNIFPIAHQS